MHQSGLTNNTTMYPQATLKLARSASDQNTVLTYVCLVNDITPNGHSSAAPTHHKLTTHVDPDTAQELDIDDEHLKVERSKALHELVESHKNSNAALDANRRYENCFLSPITSGEESDYQNDTDSLGNPNILRLTKMKWLTENKDGAPDSSSPSISPSSSSSSLSKDSQIKLNDHNLSDKYLSTILRLDKEHNLFGLSNIAIVGSPTSKKTRKDDDKPVFHQTAIVQICCKGGSCCNHRSQTDLPSSLRCGGCSRCCAYVSDCPSCISYVPSCYDEDCLIIPCKKKRASPSCSLTKCYTECQPCTMKLALNRKEKFDPVLVEVTPRSSCVLQKPASARSCHHLPRCIPPSTCFPYLMPCYWPARPSAPCTNPARCFHTPPCMAPRRPRSARSRDDCPRVGTCADKAKAEGKADNKNKCKNLTCPGNNPDLKKAIEERFK